MWTWNRFWTWKDFVCYQKPSPLGFMPTKKAKKNAGSRRPGKQAVTFPATVLFANFYGTAGFGSSCCQKAFCLILLISFPHQTSHMAGMQVSHCQAILKNGINNRSVGGFWQKAKWLIEAGHS